MLLLDHPSASLKAFIVRHPGRDFDRGNGVKLHYLDEGSGDPVVMVHGNPTWSFYYRNLASRLAESGQYRVIVPDHVGCGRSDKPGDDQYDYTLASRVDDLDKLLDHLGVTQNITLVVHDWGGMIGLTYAVRHPERIARLVVLNTGAFPLPPSKWFPWPLWICRNTKVGAMLVRGGNAFAAIAARECCKRHPMGHDLRSAYTAPYDSWDHRIATLRFVQDIPLRAGDRGFDLIQSTADGLSQFQDRPMLIAWGLKDFVFDHHFLAEWVRRFPGAEVHRFKDCGHYILEDARDEVIPLVESFLQRHPLAVGQETR